MSVTKGRKNSRLASRSGASIAIALIVLTFCSVFTVLMLSASSADTGKISTTAKQEGKALIAQSMADLICSELDGVVYRIDPDGAITDMSTGTEMGGMAVLAAEGAAYVHTTGTDYAGKYKATITTEDGAACTISGTIKVDSIFYRTLITVETATIDGEAFSLKQESYVVTITFLAESLKVDEGTIQIKYKEGMLTADF